MDKTAGFVKACLNFDGGFGSRPGAESHAGILIHQSINQFFGVEKLRCGNLYNNVAYSRPNGWTDWAEICCKKLMGGRR